MGLNSTFVEAVPSKPGANAMFRKLSIMAGLVAILAVSASDFAAARVAGRPIYHQPRPWPLLVLGGSIADARLLGLLPVVRQGR